jgi:hypothetical protein
MTADSQGSGSQCSLRLEVASPVADDEHVATARAGWAGLRHGLSALRCEGAQYT